jgi:hypothetical protein
MIIEGELEGASNSLQLSAFEREAVWLKLLCLFPPWSGTVDSSAVQFETRADREAAITDYTRRSKCTRNQLAKAAGVDYSDLNKWKLQGNAAFSKTGNRSQKTMSIETELLRRSTS